jgi:hypothetical protein
MPKYIDAIIDQELFVAEKPSKILWDKILRNKNNERDYEVDFFERYVKKSAKLKRSVDEFLHDLKNITKPFFTDVGITSEIITNREFLKSISTNQKFIHEISNLHLSRAQYRIFQDNNNVYDMFSFRDEIYIFRPKKVIRLTAYSPIFIYNHAYDRYLERIDESKWNASISKINKLCFGLISSIYLYFDKMPHKTVLPIMLPFDEGIFLGCAKNHLTLQTFISTPTLYERDIRTKELKETKFKNKFQLGINGLVYIKTFIGVNKMTQEQRDIKTHLEKILNSFDGKYLHKHALTKVFTNGPGEFNKNINKEKNTSVSQKVEELSYPFTPLFEEKKFIGCVFSKVH